MLILTRRIGESIVIGDDIFLTITGTRNGVVNIGIEAPRSVKIVRKEILRQPSLDSTSQENADNKNPDEE